MWVYQVQCHDRRPQLLCASYHHHHCMSIMFNIPSHLFIHKYYCDLSEKWVRKSGRKWQDCYWIPKSEWVREKWENGWRFLDVFFRVKTVQNVCFVSSCKKVVRFGESFDLRDGWRWKEKLCETGFKKEHTQTSDIIGKPSKRFRCLFLPLLSHENDGGSGDDDDDDQNDHARRFMNVDATRATTFPAIFVAIVDMTLDFCLFPTEFRNLFLDSDFRWFFISILSPRL